jgi:hypothetical protein
VQAIQQTLLDDPNVTRLVYSTQVQVYENYRCLFANEPRVMEQMKVDDVSPIFRIGIAGGQAEVDRITGAMSARITGHQVLIYSDKGYEVPTSTTPTTGLDHAAAVGRMIRRTPDTLQPCSLEGSTLR